MTTDQFVTNFYAAVDSLDVERQNALMTPDVVFRFGNLPAIKGHNSHRIAFGKMLDIIDSMRHEILSVWPCGDCRVVESRVTYGDKFGRSFNFPACTFIFERDGLISELRIFVDNHELFVPPSAALPAAKPAA
jgi:ketosteroid isomerase-like protein